MNELLLFAKAPRVGQVKTRLAEYLGAERALQAYCRLLEVVARKVGELEPATVYFTPVDSEGELRPFFPRHWGFRAQEGADLGERLRNALAASFAAGSERVVVIGADCPYIRPADIEEAWQYLDVHDLIVGPAEDGGYWLIGMKKCYPELFSGIQWGTETVFDATLARARELHLQVGVFRTLSDVDTMLQWQAFLGSSESRLER